MTAPDFFAEPAEKVLVEKLSTLSPCSPFATWGFMQSKTVAGSSAWALGLKNRSGEVVAGCGAFLTSRRLGRALNIPSLPGASTESVFWDGLRVFCRRQDVSTLTIGTSGSPAGVEIPSLDGDCTKRSRCEFVLDLTGDIASVLRSNHKRNIRKAEKAGLIVRRSRATEALIVHRKLMDQSMERRRMRGENIDQIGPSPEHVAFLENGVGELFQAVHEDSVLSSVLVLHAPTGGYYQSAGTSPEGMAMSASHFLINRIAIALRDEGRMTLNLGGADVDSGLARFKEGFGASRVPLPTATYFLGPLWRRKILQAVRQFRSGLTTLLRSPVN